MNQETLPLTTAVLETADETGRGLRVEFFLVDNRYAHRIVAFGEEGKSARLLETVEGEPGDPWTLGPALQSLNIDDCAEGTNESRALPRPAMLLGMSGSSHWSLSIEAIRSCSEQPTCPGFVFDVACRMKQKPPNRQIARPGSHYAIPNPVEPVMREGWIELHFGWGRCRLEPLESVCRLDDINESVTIRDPCEIPGELPATLRWRYVMRLLG